MATEQLSPESTPQKRQRRLKQDPQFIFDHSPTDEMEVEAAAHSTKPRSIIKTKAKPVQSVDEHAPGADLYEPGDIVWSKLGSFPWWPALIYRCDAEGGIFTRTLNSNNKSKRQYFVYFYGKYLEYSWLSTRSLLNYAGLNNFIQQAEAAVQQASTKSEQVELANRYQLKVSMKKRVQWDEAIELADRALTMTKEERIKEFHDLLNEVKTTKKQSSTNTRRRKISPETPSKRLARRLLSTSFSSDLPDGTNNVETSSHVIDVPSIENGNKNKRSRKPKINEHQSVPVAVDRQTASSSFNHFVQANIPPLSNYEQKQIVEGLLSVNQQKAFTFEEAQAFAHNKAIEIIYENFNHRMDHISPEWFYDSILLKYPSVVYKYRSWFDHIKSNLLPAETDPIQLKQWQIALMIEAHAKAEQQQEQVVHEDERKE